jgi:GAF domain-containing protein
LIGVMALFGLRAEKKFRSEQVVVAEGIARLAAIAVQNARLFEEVRWRAEESQALIRTARSVTASLDLVTVLSLIAEQARDLLRADGSRIHLLDPERNVLRWLCLTWSGAWPALETGPASGSSAGSCSMRPLLTNDQLGPHAFRPGTPRDEPECRW